MPTRIALSGLPALLRELKRLSEAAQGRVARNMTMAGALLAALRGVTVRIRTMPSIPFEPNGKYRIVQSCIPAREPGRAEIQP